MLLSSEKKTWVRNREGNKLPFWVNFAVQNDVETLHSISTIAVLPRGVSSSQSMRRDRQMPTASSPSKQMLNLARLVRKS